MQGQRNEAGSYFFSQCGNENVILSTQIKCPAKNNSGLRTANDYFVENKTQTRFICQLYKQLTGVRWSFKWSRNPYSIFHGSKYTKDPQFKRISDFRMSDDNSSKQMFATDTRNNVSSGHMKANNFVLDNRQRREKVSDLFNGENVEWADSVCHFEQVSIWSKWSESKTATQLAMSLLGSASMWSDPWSADKLWISKICFNLKRFNPTERKTAYRSGFKTGNDSQERQ